jgi:transposase
MRCRAKRSHVHDQAMLGDAEWAALKDKLRAIGRIWKHGDEGRNRCFLAGVCYLLRTGLAWADLPHRSAALVRTSRPWGYWIGSLTAARAAFTADTKLVMEWEGEDEG